MWIFSYTFCVVCAYQIKMCTEYGNVYAVKLHMSIKKCIEQMSCCVVVCGVYYLDFLLKFLLLEKYMYGTKQVRWENIINAKR